MGDHSDITEQLEGGQFTCNDIVTYLAHIEMEDVVVDANQSARLSLEVDDLEGEIIGAGEPLLELEKTVMHV